jgi:hypothetical protein
MKREIPLSLLVAGVFLIFILSLLWTNPAQGMPDPKSLKGHPWDDMLAPPANDTTVNILMLSIGSNTILTFKLTRTISATKSIDQSNTNREKWTKAPKVSP